MNVLFLDKENNFPKKIPLEQLCPQKDILIQLQKQYLFLQLFNNALK